MRLFQQILVNPVRGFESSFLVPFHNALDFIDSPHFSNDFTFFQRFLLELSVYHLLTPQKRNTTYYKELKEVLSKPTISLLMDNRNIKFLRNYAKLKNTSVLDLMRNPVIEKIEDELDAKNFDRILATMEKNYSLNDVKKELGS